MHHEYFDQPGPVTCYLRPQAGNTMSSSSVAANPRLAPVNTMIRKTVHLCALLIVVSSSASERIPVILDTDIGSDVDDAFALALVLASPELELRGVTTVGKQAEDRAWMVCRFLTHSQSRAVPVAFGREEQPTYDVDWQIQYRRHPGVIFNRTCRPLKVSAVEFLYQQLKADPGNITIITVGPLTNIAQLIKEHPDCKPWIKQVILMGGSIRVGYDGSDKPEPEWNIKSDIRAAQTVFQSGLPLVVAPLDATAVLALDEMQRTAILAANTPLTHQLQALLAMWNKPTPVLYDPVAIALAFDDRFCSFEQLHINVDDEGMTTIGKGKPNAHIAVSVNKDDFLKWYIERIASHGSPSPPKPPANPSKLVERGGLPNRVHTFEDYETEIEKRWWMSGKLESKKVPPGSKRACRGIVTRDFDAKMGDLSTSYSAVIFNPVPGPPMGQNTRLSFHYWLTGTDTIRVQLYSLSNGYHRYLSVTGLPQGRWESATVDMTKMRRPDGSGGPLSENERIDDIQFYVDPQAEILIDDIVLYDASLNNESRPFPKRIVFTGWFDTGKQGKEWPGDFEIVKHESPRTWKAAKSVRNSRTDQPWIRVSFRGRRPLGKITRVRFKYRLTSKAANLRVVLLDSKSGRSMATSLIDLAVGDWAEAAVDFKPAADDKSAPLTYADEMRFYAPNGSELLLDDLLVYEPGS
jgi:purine nucleosidase